MPMVTYILFSNAQMAQSLYTLLPFASTEVERNSEIGRSLVKVGIRTGTVMMMMMMMMMMMLLLLLLMMVLF